MNEKRSEESYYEDKIDLSELIITLWKRKKMILCITLVIAIIAGILSMFVFSPIYETKLNIAISMPQKYNTRYGEYILPITTNQQYINLITSNDVLINTIDEMGYDVEEVSIDGIKNSIIVSQNDSKTGNINIYEVTVSADNPKKSLKLAQTLYSNYLDFMDAMTKERAVNYYYNNFSVELKALENSLNSEKEILMGNEELLLQTSQIIGAGKANFEIKSKLNETSDYIVPIDTVNPNYIKIENDIVANKQKINSIEKDIRMYQKYLQELDDELIAINKYYRTGEAEKLESSIIGVVDTYVYLPSSPVEPTLNTSPSNILIVAVGVVLGGIIGVMTALIQEYWFKERKNN